MRHAAILLIAILLSALTGSLSHAQSASESKAKAYFFSAQDSFAAKDYVNALNYLQSAENLLGKSNARIEALRAKTLYHKGDVEGAKRSLDKFFGYAPSASLTREMMGYTRDIEAKYEEGKARAAAARRAQAEKDRQARIAADKHLREQAEAAIKEQARQAQRDIEREKMRTLIAEIHAPCVSVEKCQEAIGENWADNLGLYSKVSKETNLKKKEELIKQYADYLQKKWLLYWKKCQLGVLESCHYYAEALIETASWINKYKNTFNGRAELVVIQSEVLAGKNCTSSDLGVCLNTTVLERYKENCDIGYAKSCIPYAHNWNTVIQLKLETRRTKLDILKKVFPVRSYGTKVRDCIREDFDFI